MERVGANDSNYSRNIQETVMLEFSIAIRMEAVIEMTTKSSGIFGKRASSRWRRRSGRNAQAC